MSLTDLIIATLAVWEIIEIWHHSSLFANWRAKVETCTGIIGNLLTCMFCLSVWVSFLITTLMIQHLILKQTESSLVLFFAYLIWVFINGLAVARLANLCNDITHKWCRTPKRDKELPNQKILFESEERHNG